MAHQRLPISVDLGRAPWCEAASRASRRAGAKEDVNQALVDAAQGAGGDAALLRSVARRLHDDGGRMDPGVRRLVTAALRRAARAVVRGARGGDRRGGARSAADAAAVAALGQSLEAAVATLEQRTAAALAVCARWSRPARSRGA
jgi:hypothetical protein